MRHDSIEYSLSIENKMLKNKKGEYDHKWLYVNRVKQLSDVYDEKRAKFLMGAL